MESIRGIFKVGELTQYGWANRAAYVKMESCEDTPFAGSMSIMITDPAVIAHFPLGKRLEVEFRLLD